MTKKTISELTDIELTQEPGAVCAVEQNGATFKARIRPNPPDQINIETEQQLIDALGGSLVLPVGITKIVLDGDVTLTNPITYVTNSSLEIDSSTGTRTLTYSGAGSLFQPDSAGLEMSGIRFDKIRFLGDGTNSLFDVIGNATQGANFVANDIQIQDFLSVGSIDNFNALDIDTLVVNNCERGLVISNYSAVSINEYGIVNTTETGPLTALSFIVDTVNPSNTILDSVPGIVFNAGQSLLFFDPNAPTGSSFIVEKSSVSAGDFYQLGTDIAVNSVASGGAGLTTFTTGVSHGLSVGEVTVNSGFSLSTDYNGTFAVVAVDTPVTGTTYTVEATFTVDNTGNMNKSSLDQTDNRVTATSNPGQSQSMAQAEARSNVTLTNTADAVDTFEPINNEIPAVDDFVEDSASERFFVNTTTGLITYTGIEPLSATISFEFTANRSGAGSIDAQFALFQNGTQATKTNISTTSFSTTPTFFSYNGGLFTINPNDTLQLQYSVSSTANDDIFNSLTILISQQ